MLLLFLYAEQLVLGTLEFIYLKWKTHTKVVKVISDYKKIIIYFSPLSLSKRNPKLTNFTLVMTVLFALFAFTFPFICEC